MIVNRTLTHSLTHSLRRPLQVPSCISSKSPRLHASNPNLSTAEPSSPQDPCLESPDSPTDANRLQEDFCRLANNSEWLGLV